jgi:dolichyl-phosphate-mannose--protein O-mannosyl transferase
LGKVGWKLIYRETTLSTIISWFAVIIAICNFQMITKARIKIDKASLLCIILNAYYVYNITFTSGLTALQAMNNTSSKQKQHIAEGGVGGGVGGGGSGI